jgi:hypothetical protein
LATVVGVAVAMGATVLGLGATDHALATSNASMWLWSSSRGEIARVNAETGRVDTRYKVVDAQGHVIQVSQTDRYLVMRDLNTGKVSSLDLSTLQIAATTQTTPGLGLTVVLSGDSGFIIDSVQGVVRQLDPLTLTPAGEPLRFPPGLSGGAFDGNGTLWLLVPTEGTVVGIRPGVTHPSKGAKTTAAGGGGAGPSIAQTVAVGDPGHDLTMSTLDNGVAVLDQTGDTLTTVRGAQKHTLPVPMSGAGTLPAQTGGSGASVPVTVEDDRHVYVVSAGHVSDFAVPGSGGRVSPAVSFAGRLYVADNSNGVVYVLDATGSLISSIRIPNAGGSLELQVKTDHLFINAPNSSTARVVDDHNRVKVVDKYANNVLGGDPPPNPPPPPLPPPPPPVGPPGAPTKVLAVAGNASAHITWGAAPANGSAVTKYVVEGAGAPHEVGARQRSLDVAGLVNGQQYKFSVYAVNAKGAGPKRVANPVVPTAEVPDAPASVTAQEQKDGSVVLRWPMANGQGRKILQYSVAAVSGGAAVDPMTTKETTLTIPPGKLAYGTQYAFTVTAVNDRGASSKASPPSNTVVPYTLPGKPGNLTAKTVDAKGAISVAWSAAQDNGRPITKYVVSAGTTSQDVTGATSVTLNGFDNGATVKVSVKAVNLAGDGPVASGTAKTIDVPVITAGSASAGGFNSIKVSFTVNGNGSATSCTISVNGGAAAGIGCTGGTRADGIWPGTTYNFTITATNRAGSDSYTGKVTTATVTGTVVCTDNSYCGSGSTTGGIWVYTSPAQTKGTEVGAEFAPAQVTVQCWTSGESVNGAPYGGRQSSQWLRIPYKGNNYIPYAWVNLNSASMSNLPEC